MKAYHKIIMGLASAALLTACSDFEDINKDPGAVDKDKVKVSYLLNKSIIGAQQNPYIAERLFVYQWKSAARFERRAGLAVGANYDDYNSDYLGTSFGVGWLNDVNMAVNIGYERQGLPETPPYENNVLQIARIWRAYVISELADCFGPIPPVNSFDGEVKYESVEDLYDFMLTELTDTVDRIDTGVDMSNVIYEKTDAFYDGNVSKWIKYANSLRMRYAMRLSEVAPEKARKAFEAAAATNNFITTLADMAAVQEKDGYSELTGVMSRGWNAQPISVTLNNLMIGLGGIGFQVPEAIRPEVTLKDARAYMGIRLDQHLTTATNDPAAGYFFDALPATIDPRATVLFHIPGYDDGVHYFSNIDLATTARLADPATGNVEEDGKPYMELNVKYTWNTWVTGKWDKYSSLSAELTGMTKTYPLLSKTYRESRKERVWFGPWETYFLLAEAAHYGWNVPGSAQSNYEAGIAASFEYYGLSEFVAGYIASTEYNRVGTSVAFNHTTEATPYEVTYIDGYTGEQRTTTYQYPQNTIYKNGAYNNDVLTKIISQKYLAQMPWLPLEVWSDHRRLGLPFFENPAVEIDYNTTSNEVALTRRNYHECRWDFYQERLRYPAKLEINSAGNYREAISLLGGDDLISTPLWWTKRR